MKSPRRDLRVPYLRQVAGNVRLRILASYVILLALAAFGSVLVVRQVLIVRMDERVERDLSQEVREFRRLAVGNDPETGRPFNTNVNRIFDVYLDRNVPGAGEQLLVVPRRGTPRYRATEQADVLMQEAHIERWRDLAEPEEGEVATAKGPALYRAVPLLVDDRPRGAFVVAYFTASDREQVNEAVRIAAAAAVVALLLGAVVAFAAAGRVLLPLREFRDAAREVSGANMSRRIEVEGSDELADLGRTFNTMLDRLEFAFSSQRDFIRDVSHELRTPIAVVRGYLELMYEGRLDDPAERRAAITLATGELDRMSGFVDDLLLLAKAERPDFLSLETVDVGATCEGVLANARTLADRDWRMEATTRRLIVADKQRMVQALMNLVRNAIEHTDEGGVIEIGGEVSDDEASFRVRDLGVGIAPEDQARIFERFERATSGGRRYEGSGLGLAIVRAVAEAHGGRVELESELGVGSTFTIRVPVDGPAGTEPLI